MGKKSTFVVGFLVFLSLFRPLMWKAYSFTASRSLVIWNGEWRVFTFWVDSVEALPMTQPSSGSSRPLDMEAWSSACRSRRLGFKVGQLMPGSSRAEWTSLVAVWGSVLEEPPGSLGCQSDEWSSGNAAKWKSACFGSAATFSCSASQFVCGWNTFFLL